MKKVGVFFATREGHARKIATHVAAVLVARDLEVAVHDVRDVQATDALTLSDAAVLVGSVDLGKHEDELVAFVRAHHAKLEAIPSAFLSVSSSEAVVEDLTQGLEVRGAAVERVKAQLHAFTAATGWHPAHVWPVAGALVYTHYNPLVRWIVQQIAKAEKLPTDTARDYDLTDWLTLDEFAERLASELHGPRDLA